MNSSRGWGGQGRNSSRGGGRVQVHGNFHILTSKQNKPGGGVKPLTNLGSATVMGHTINIFISYINIL